MTFLVGGLTKGEATSSARVGSLQPGLRDAKYLAMPEKKLHRKGDSGTVAMLRFDFAFVHVVQQPQPVPAAMCATPA
jgi:hypothetical protein